MSEPVIGTTPCYYCEKVSLVVVNSRPGCGDHVDKLMSDMLSPIQKLLHPERTDGAL
jgi:predicted RNA-binding protein with PUA domain